MAHIRRHPKAKDRWQVRYVDPSGRERAKNFSRESDAERFLVSIEADKLRGDWVDPRLAKTSFEEWTGRWWGATSHLKTYTRDGYASLLRVHVFPRFAQASLGSIRPLTSGSGWQTLIVPACQRRGSARRTSCWHRFSAQLSNRVTWRRTRVLG
jgi:hypothetical protein